MLYHLPARGAPDGHEGVVPDLPEGVQITAWVGVYDEATHTYVIKTHKPIKGLAELKDGKDIGFDYSRLHHSKLAGEPEPT